MVGLPEMDLTGSGAQRVGVTHALGALHEECFYGVWADLGPLFENQRDGAGDDR